MIFFGAENIVLVSYSKKNNYFCSPEKESCQSGRSGRTRNAVYG